jgi:hypothetical protein
MHFGSPRVGDSAFARAFNAKLSGKSFRYVNAHDVVTHVPPPIDTSISIPALHWPDGAVSDGRPAISHFFADLIGKPGTFLEVIEGSRSER